jgi:hypothetical protein
VPTLVYLDSRRLVAGTGVVLPIRPAAARVDLLSC